ncbi:thioesterase [Longispora sp. NPDC051575]|uniref:thioesterase n=1 Tax=Longispora sp. NPDC051575 TaxID=3154943 RepID=UPI003425CEFF
MTDTLTSALLDTTTTVRVRPRYEGSNICTWIGFKHVNYLVEEAVLEHFRQSGTPARALFEDHALCVDLVSLDTRILHALHMDDEATATVVPATKAADDELAFAVTLTVERGGEVLKAVVSKVRVALRLDERDGPGDPAPAALSPYVTTDIARPASSPVPLVGPLGVNRGTSGGDPVLAQLTAGRNAFAWRWRIPYPYCHFTQRLQMSGYLRQMEEVVDLFLAERGISIRTLLTDRNWIPVVPRSTIELVGEALMEEDLYTVFTVEDVFKDFTYTARMDCFVVRDGELVLTATGSITHGYAVIENRRDWSLVGFDDTVLAALRGRN